MTIYCTNILGMGDNAVDFSIEQTFITFAKDIPDTLEKYCYYIEHATLIREIAKGDILQIDGIDYPITAVGSAVNDNLKQYGHACFKFNGKQSEEMPGVINLEAGRMPQLQVGSELKVISKTLYQNTTQILESDLMVRESYTDFMDKNAEKIKRTKLSVFLKELVFKTGEGINEMFRASGLSPSYVYQILNGERIPSRDKLILFAFAMRLSLNDLNKALKYAQKSELYVKDERDCIIMHGLVHKKGVQGTNQRLKEKGFEPLK
ncbi:MAG: PTS glucitol/sorbitol transporter subunit IIA [Bacillota bacterium]|nr:PTS glucitol/sorbitol transporter subunit IIA [Bacillota bacterium]